jgi:pSer/pThr/pTyr-binding forkhead associated (FHA) protein
MTFRLICQEGPRKGQEYLVKDTVEVGRSVGDVQLKDPKASNPHAKIFNDPAGLLHIEDLKSFHGTWVNGLKIQQVTPLKVGDKITCGKTVLDVAEGEFPKKDTLSEKGSWEEKVEIAMNAALLKELKGVKPTSASLPFNEPVVLEFAQGIQTGQTLVFGFGPRSVGKNCGDGLLMSSEETALAVAFELVPVPGHLCELRTQAENIQVNGAEVKVQKLESGDRISVGQTVMVVRTFKSL